MLSALLLATLMNVPYVEGGGHQQQLDLYTPETKGFPTIVWIHGGSLVNGDRNDKPYEDICRNFVKAGIGCANISYRLAPDSKWPAMPDDVASAFAWVKANITKYRGDPSRVFLTGHSSGCFLASLVGVDERYLHKHGLSSSDVAGVVAMGCTLNPWDIKCIPNNRAHKSFEADREEKAIYASFDDRVAANPSLYISAKTPRFLVMLAESERFQPSILEEGAAFVRRMIEEGRSGDVMIFANRKHYTLMEGLANANDPAFAAFRDFVLTP